MKIVNSLYRAKKIITNIDSALTKEIKGSKILDFYIITSNIAYYP